LALALVVGLAPVPAGAAAQDDGCMITNQDEQLAHADVVFKGTLDSTRSAVIRDSDGVVHQSGLVHKFIPTSVYEGTVYRPQYVVEPASDQSSGTAMTGPGPYLVFADVPSDAEQAKYDLADTDLLLKPCGGTRPIDADDEPSFGPGTPVTSKDVSKTAAEDVPARAEDDDSEFPLPGFGYLTDLLDRLLAYVGEDDDEGTPVERVLGQLDREDDKGPFGRVLGPLNRDDDGLLEQLLELLGLVDDDDEDSPLGSLIDDDDGLLEQLLVLLGLREDDDEDGLVLITPDTLLLIDPATLQKELDEMGMPDPNGLQEQLKELGIPQGPGGGDGDTVSLAQLGNLGGLGGEDGGSVNPLDLGGLGGIGTPPPPGSAAS
jgi:hypothetical protein